jgi:hypothetical protein
MRGIADRFKYMLLDAQSRNAASLICSGAPFWRNQVGGLTVVRDAFVYELESGQSARLSSLLGITPTTTRKTVSESEIDPQIVALVDADNHPYFHSRSRERDMAEA